MHMQRQLHKNTGHKSTEKHYQVWSSYIAPILTWTSDITLQTQKSVHSILKTLMIISESYNQVQHSATIACILLYYLLWKPNVKLYSRPQEFSHV